MSVLPFLNCPGFGLLEMAFLGKQALTPRARLLISRLGKKHNHKDVCLPETFCVSVPQKQFLTKQSEISKA